MKLKDCTHGKIITDGEKVGMIVGITNNTPNCDQETRSKMGRAIPLVQWSFGGTSGIHHANIEPLK